MKNPHRDVISLDFEADEPISERTQRYFDICDEKQGLVPNVLKAYSFNEEKLNSFTALYNDLMLGSSSLSKLQREMIAVTVSAYNKCVYCLTAHGAAVRELSGDPMLGEMLVMNYRAADVSDADRAMLDFAHKLTAQPAEVDEPDRQALRDTGWSDRDIWDIANVTGFFNMTNRVATATDMKPNDEYHAMAR